jgi:carbonic anhydrase/acetyltransferase-like protein (isoleucine patch superfamily)
MALYSFKNFSPKIDPSVFVAPTAQIIGNVNIERQSSIWFGAVLRADFDKISIGQRTNIQDLCVCHADENIPLKVGNGVTIGHRCIIHGCTIEDNCLIGMGSIIMNQTVIGEGSVVAAGTVVLEKTVIPPYSLVVGSPGKIKKSYENREKIKKDIKIMSEWYIQNTQDFDSEQIFYEIKD